MGSCPFVRERLQARVRQQSSPAGGALTSGRRRYGAASARDQLQRRLHDARHRLAVAQVTGDHGHLGVDAQGLGHLLGAQLVVRHRHVGGHHQRHVAQRPHERQVGAGGAQAVLVVGVGQQHPGRALAGEAPPGLLGRRRGGREDDYLFGRRSLLPVAVARGQLAGDHGDLDLLLVDELHAQLFDDVGVGERVEKHLVIDVDRTADGHAQASADALDGGLADGDEPARVQTVDDLGPVEAVEAAVAQDHVDVGAAVDVDDHAPLLSGQRHLAAILHALAVGEVRHALQRAELLEDELPLVDAAAAFHDHVLDVHLDEDVLVEMNVENVIMEGCRRIDEWELIFEQLGSLERVPHLAYSQRVEDRGEMTLTAEEWRVIVHIDGRADINVILRDCGLDRFHGAKVIYSLYSSGLIGVSEPAIEGIGRGLSVAVRGPIDIYNEVFLNTLTDSNVVKQLRVELIDEKEVEIPVVAGQLPSSNGDGDEATAAEEVVVFTAASSSPEQAWRRLAGESSAWVLLANANDQDSLRATRADLAFVRSLGDVPLVVATYVSMAADELSPKQVAKALGVDAKVPVIPCHLRDRESVTSVVKAALELVAR